jgi:hypothetical protein
MPRVKKIPSAIFSRVIAEARNEVLLDAAKAAHFHHTGIRGDERAAGLKHFFSSHLPAAFGLAKGEVIDYGDRRTGQLDLFIFDKISCSPLSVQSENVLLPCESLYVVIEVKSVLSQKELETCYEAAAKVRSLRPFKRQFISSRTGGAGAEDGGSRCLYIVFAYTTNLSATDWSSKEFGRVCTAAGGAKVSEDLVDLVVVLDRGLINPGKGVGKSIGEDPMEIFMEFYLHVINFLNREYQRRPIIDWQDYGAGSQRKWVRLDGTET